MTRTGIGLTLSLTCVAVTAAAQGPTALTGIDSRGYYFRPGVGARTVAQLSVPMVVIVPVGGDFTADIGTRWAYTNLTSYDGTSDNLSGFTDTQLRLGYAIGQDVAMATIAVGLPTGLHTVTSDKFSVISALGSDFVTLPVSTYGMGPSVTGGLAGTRTLGGLNLGFGASARWSGSYTPFSDQQLQYQPGVETRFQIAGDGLVGSGRLRAGLTYSTFGSDNFTGAGTGLSQAYSPGGRAIMELSYAARAGNGTLQLFGWDFVRSAGAAGTATVDDSKENVADLGAAWQLPAGTGISLSPGVEFRSQSQGGSLAGELGSIMLATDIAAPANLTLQASGRADWGFVVSPAGDHVITQGWGFALLLRRQF